MSALPSYLLDTFADCPPSTPQIISYRDHPPQDRTYVTKTLPFTSSISELKAELASLTASGGGDGPEAATSAMYEALTGVQWRQHSAKMIVLVTDAAPHGIGEVGDGFPAGDPDGHDPLALAREMASKGITFVSFVLFCFVSTHSCVCLRAPGMHTFCRA